MVCRYLRGMRLLQPEEMTDRLQSSKSSNFQEKTTALHSLSIRTFQALQVKEKAIKYLKELSKRSTDDHGFGN